MKSRHLQHADLQNHAYAAFDSRPEQATSECRNRGRPEALAIISSALSAMLACQAEEEQVKAGP
jgi:hypothetical protein